MLTDADIALRRTGLTASDMVALSGTVRFKRARTVHDVWLDKCHPELAPRTEISEAMELGNAAEPLIVAQTAHKLHMAVDYPQRSRRHREVPWKICTPDGIVVSNTEHVGVVQSNLSHEHMTEEGLLEAKLVGLHMAPYWDAAHENDEGPPEYVYVQVCWGMHVLELPYAIVAAMIGTQIRTYRVEFGDGERELCDALTALILHLKEPLSEARPRK